MKSLSKLDDILRILKELDFEVSKEIENPTFLIRTAKPIIKMSPDNKSGKSYEFSVKATHSSKAAHYLAVLEILDLFNLDKSFLIKSNPYSFGGYDGNVTSDFYLEVYKDSL